ncbi:DUF4183 domain-containing protein [Paenibacillus sp. 598K]|uniref:DUF4183 domain-containing protein n=1 Tax=Paenibacillus sp. 598K TaxID=1117987 RepID=UPI000FFEEFBB|nr:DUF4183 domain-containing protein [Paenibacillus sp. 598K]
MQGIAATGLPGPIGNMGPAGPGGLDGAVGPAGLGGPAGTIGALGPPGPIGPAGPIGPPGPVGPAGAVGPVGPPGAVGPVGPAGAVGPAGPVGPTGPQGVPGEVTVSIIPTAYRYFHLPPGNISSTVILPASQFTDDNGRPVDGFEGMGSNGYTNLFINGVLQESSLYRISEQFLTLFLSGDTVLARTPIVIENVAFEAQTTVVVIDDDARVIS